MARKWLGGGLAVSQKWLSVVKVGSRVAWQRGKGGMRATFLRVIGKSRVASGQRRVKSALEVG